MKLLAVIDCYPTGLSSALIGCFSMVVPDFLLIFSIAAIIAIALYRQALLILVWNLRLIAYFDR